VIIVGCGLRGAHGDGRQTLAASRGEAQPGQGGQGQRGLGTLSLSGVSGLPSIRGAACAEDADPLPYLGRGGRKLLKYANGSCRLVLCAAGEALTMAGLADDEQRRSEAGLFLATGLIAFDLAEVRRGIDAVTDEQGQVDVARVNEGLRRCHPLMPFKMLSNMPLGLTSIAYGLGGDNAILYPGAAQSGAALEQALAALRGGHTPRVLWGGTVQQASLLPLSVLRRHASLAPGGAGSEPTKQVREDGAIAPADGAAIVVLEREELARARGARALARVLGVQSHPPGWSQRETVEALVRRLLDGQAGLEPRSVLVSGVTDPQSRRALETRTSAAGSALRLESYDGLLGALGAAALPSAVALGAQRIAAAELDAPLLAVALDPRGGGAAALLDRGQP
jgi:hypothetical protein